MYRGYSSESNSLQHPLPSGALSAEAKNMLVEAVALAVLATAVVLVSPRKIARANPVIRKGKRRYFVTAEHLRRMKGRRHRR